MVRSRFDLTAVLVLGLVASSLPVYAEPQPATSPQIESGALASHWYMGTATGIDCNLEFIDSSRLRVRRGGCFHTGPWVESTWSRSGNKIFINDLVLQNDLGHFLLITSYKSNLILVPEHNLSIVKKRAFSPNHCFWVNLLGSGGLELSKDSNNFQW